MYFSAFPEDIFLTRCLLLSFKMSVISPEEVFFPPTLCKVIFCPKASLLAVSVQPRAVLLHLPSDNEQHLCHVLRKLFSEKCAETEAKREKVRRTQTVGILIEHSVLTQNKQ